VLLAVDAGDHRPGRVVVGRGLGAGLAAIDVEREAVAVVLRKPVDAVVGPVAAGFEDLAGEELAALGEIDHDLADLFQRLAGDAFLGLDRARFGDRLGDRGAALGGDGLGFER